MDEVLAQWCNSVMFLWNMANPSRKIDKAVEWDIDTWLGREGKEFAINKMLKIKFWTDLKPIPGAIEGMRALNKAGHDIKIVTQILPEVGGASYEGKIEWIK